MSSSDESPEIDSEKVLRDVPSILDKTGPLLSSYTYHSPTPTAAGPYILGVDEAGRGPVLGPLVYGVAYCPVAYREQLDNLGFAGTLILARTVPSIHFGTV
jgi:ribonuclease H2 subunit A